MKRKIQRTTASTDGSSVRAGIVGVCLAGAVVVGAGCQHGIGDACTTNVQCSPTGGRICDTAQLGGYCTVVGCSAKSCPKNSICVRFFPAKFLPNVCNPQTEDAVTGKATDDCTIDEICISSGQCVLRAQERRFCMASCEQDSDCRSGYECRRDGTLGAELVVDPEQPNAAKKRFCAQRVLEPDAGSSSTPRSDSGRTATTDGGVDS